MEDSGGTMSEQQVLPPTEHILFEGMAHVYDKTEADEYIAALRASLAQSEAERERLQLEHNVLLAAIDDCPTGREYLDADKLISAFIKEQERLREELARERERHQTARQLLREYRESHINSRRPCVDSATCSACQWTDALLEPAPVAAVEEKE